MKIIFKINILYNVQLEFNNKKDINGQSYNMAASNPKMTLFYWITIFSSYIAVWPCSFRAWVHFIFHCIIWEKEERTRCILVTSDWPAGNIYK